MRNGSCSMPVENEVNHEIIQARSEISRFISECAGSDFDDSVSLFRPDLTGNELVLFLSWHDVPTHLRCQLLFRHLLDSFNGMETSAGGRCRFRDLLGTGEKLFPDASAYEEYPDRKRHQSTYV